MSYERLSLTGFINEMKDVTYGPHPRKFCFVLGAGTSITSGIKSGQQLVKVWDKELRERNEDEYLRWRSEKGITDENMSSFYSQYYEKRFWRCPADGYNFIEKIMDQASPSVGYVMLAHLLTKTPHNVVITTNFDHLTENAISYYTNETPLAIGHEVLAHYIEGQPVRPTIIKIHRDLLFDPKSHEKDLEVLPESWKKALGRIFENYHPVFIGYAGNDKSLMDFLLDNGEKFEKGPWKFPYWMLYRSDKVDGKVQEFLQKSQGFYVEHDGFDDVMIALGANFEYKIPTKDDFMKDAQKRYDDLKDAIDAYSARESNKKIAEKDIQEKKSSPETSAKQEPEISEDQKEDRNSVTQAIDLIAGQSEEQRLFREASVLRLAGNHKKAIEILESLVEKDPDNVRYLSELGGSLYFDDEYEKTEVVLRKAISLGDTNPYSYYRLGDIYYERGEMDQAQDILGRAIDLDPKFAMAYYGLGKVHYAQGHYEKALMNFSRCAELDDKWDYIHSCISDTLIQMGYMEDALKAIDNAIERDPGWERYYFEKANILDSLGRHEEAEKVRAIQKREESE